ncbi:efflux transporter outer membrane subunit [Herbaspirillum sp. RV1423]|uniref:efflux transporter outer membrane subunit n=1 Tax=Herbaspirillum sp. RV1423 TaxID=1443993 RepID=UPI0004AFA6B9|nr:efflux transporter outer membrane subunit [Herbaspirillum sp. RV1423]
MKCASSPALRLRVITFCMLTIGILGLSGCASFSGISSDKHMAQPGDYAVGSSLAGQESGQWPAANWVEQFGDPQLTALIAEAMENSPSLQQAQARIASASALAESKGAPLLPSVSADAAVTRNLFPETTIYPPPYGGNWFNEKKAFLNLSYELDVWGKNHAALEQAVSQQKAAEAGAQETRLVLVSSIASTYNELATEYALHAILQRTLEQRESLQKITADRVRTGLDTQIERNQSQGSSAEARAQLVQSEGQITITRQQLGVLLGKGPDRGLQIAAPRMATLTTPELPAQLPLNLLGRRPDIVAARWQVEAAGKDIEVAKARFYPDINLSAMVGFDSLLNANPFTAASKSIAFGPAISLPVFEGGALRANLKGSYASYDMAVASYNQTLNDAYGDVAKQITGIRSIDRQLPIRREALAATQRAYNLAKERYRIGLTSQLVVLNAETALLAQQQALINLEASRRNQQIGLFKALGGGFDARQTGLAIAAPDASAAKPQ